MSPYEAFWGRPPSSPSILMPFGTRVVYFDEKVKDKNRNRGNVGNFLGFHRTAIPIKLLLYSQLMVSLRRQSR